MSGWEPREFIRYVYENDRLVGAEITREPEWSLHDFEMVEAQDLWERNLGPHGVPMDEATSPEADPANRDGAFHFRVDDPIVDYALKAERDAEEAYRKKWPEANMNGLMFKARKVDSRPHTGE